MAGLGIAGGSVCGLNPASGLCPAIDAGLKPHGAAAGGLGVFFEERIEQLDRLGPAMAPGLGRGRGLGSAIERARHLQNEIFAAGKLDERVGDLFADGGEMPLELGIGIGRGVLVEVAEAAGHGPSATRKETPPRT